MPFAFRGCPAVLYTPRNLTGKSNAELSPEASGLLTCADASSVCWPQQDGDGPDVGSCDYDICEAISQAMTEGAQLVPRARIAQLQARS